MISVFSNSLAEEELKAVWGVMQSKWLGMGSECSSFENEFAEHLGVDRVLLTNCATSAIYLGLRCLGLQPGDQVIIPSIHFVATAGAVLQYGGIPIFADVNPATLNLTGAEIRRLRTKKTVGVILNHYGGHPADLADIKQASMGLWILEDAANAPASRYLDQAVGTIGDAGVWSFDSMKILSMGDGGMLWLRDPDAHDRAWRLRNMGLDSLSGAEKAGSRGDKWWEFSVLEPSPRFDSNDLLAAIGRVQLGKLGAMIARRREIWEEYQEGLSDIPDCQLPPEPLPGCSSSYYLFWIQTWQRDSLARHLYDHGIYTTFRYYPLHYAFNFKNIHLADVERVATRVLCLPMHQNLMPKDIRMIIDRIREFFGVRHE